MTLATDVATVVDSAFLPPNMRHLRTALGPDIEAWEAALGVAEKSPRTIHAYRRAMAKLALMYPDTPLEGFTDTHVMAVAMSWPVGPGRKTRLHGINSFFKWAKRTRRIVENPVEYVEIPKRSRRKQINIFTDTEVEDLLTMNPERDRVLLAIMFGAGLRLSECLGLQVRRLKIEPAPAKIIIPSEIAKGGKARTVHPPFPEMVEIIRDFLLMNELEPTDYLWYRRFGRGATIDRRVQASETAFRRWWNECLYRARVRDEEKSNPHLTRHTFATNWLRAGGRLEVLSDELGHESIQTTKDMYVHLDETDVLVDLARISANRPLKRLEFAG